jgi:predicted protein tyrosine phosphatase
LFKYYPIHQARSAGTSDKARIKVSQKMIDWADVIFVMERKHLDILKQRFDFQNQTLIILDIEDNYQFGDIELISILKTSLTGYLLKKICH